jgi:FdhD protein
MRIAAMRRESFKQIRPHRADEEPSRREKPEVKNVPNMPTPEANPETSPVQSTHRNHPSIVGVRIEKMSGQVLSQVEDDIAVEEPLEIRLVYGAAGEQKLKSISVTMRTPGFDSDLAAGFLVTEGVVRDAADILNIVTTSHAQATEESPAYARRNQVSVELAEDVPVSLASLERNFYTTSSCGICGKASLLALRSVCPPRLPNRFLVAADVLTTLPPKLRRAQSVFHRTGGLHGAGLFTAAGELVMVREDVGRHNAVDKLLGAQFLAGNAPLRDNLLLLSGRASFELLQKAVMGGIPMVAAVGAPSSLAVEVAREFDITLVGFLREQRFNIYNGAERVLPGSRAAGGHA